MKIPHIFSYPFAGGSLLGDLHPRNAVDAAARQKRQKKHDICAKQFLDDICTLSRLARMLGQAPFQCSIANAFVPIGEASIISGIHLQALMSAAQNVFKLQDTNSFPLPQLAELAGREIVASFIFPWRESYQSCVKAYIQDYIKDEHQNFFLKLCADYFDMNSDDAKHFEGAVHVLAGYFRMHPPGASSAETNNFDTRNFTTQKIDTLPTASQMSTTPNSTGSVEDSIRQKQTRQACETVRTEIEQGKHGFQVRDKYKTNRDHFGRAVQAILGDVKFHRDTVREEWKKVPKDRKHIGRMPEQ